MRYFTIEKKTYCHNLGGWDADDEWSRDSYAEDHYILGIKEAKKGAYFDLPLEDGEGPIYLLYAIYDTGDSFGRDEGKFEAVMLHRNLEVAQRNKKLIEEHYRKYKEDYSFSDGAFSLKLFTDSGKEFEISVPWTGYFEVLTNVEIEGVEIL